MQHSLLRQILPGCAVKRLPFGTVYGRHALHTGAAPSLHVFNDNSKYLQKERAAADAEGSRKVDYLRDEAASRLTERLLVGDVNVTQSICLYFYRISIVILPMFWTLARMLVISLAL